MSKEKGYSSRIETRISITKKNTFEDHALKKGYTKSSLIKALIDKELKENIIPPKDY